MSASSPTAVMTMTGTPSCRARSRTSSSSPSPSGSRRSSSTASCWPLSASCAPRPACRRDPARCHGGAMRPSARRPCPPRPRPEESARAASLSLVPDHGRQRAAAAKQRLAIHRPSPMDAAVPARIICRLGAVEYDRPLTAPHQLLAVHGTSPVDAAIAAGVVVRRGHHHGRRRHHDHRRAAVDPILGRRGGRRQAGAGDKQQARRDGLEATVWANSWSMAFPETRGASRPTASIEGVDCVNIARGPPARACASARRLQESSHTIERLRHVRIAPFHARRDVPPSPPV